MKTQGRQERLIECRVKARIRRADRKKTIEWLEQSLLDIYARTGGVGPVWEELTETITGAYRDEMAVRAERHAPRSNRGGETWLRRQLKTLDVKGG